MASTQSFTETTNSTDSKSVAVIIGSTRAVRIGPEVAKLVLEILSAAEPSIKFTLVDVADFKLPVFDEVPMPATVPAMGGKFEHEHTLKWSAAIASFDGYVLVSPEYNYGPPGGVKNAIDYLYNEWVGKPMVIVTYGIFGGAKSNAALKTTLSGMKLDVVETTPQLSYPDADPANRNFSKTLLSSMSGQLHEDAVKAWKGDPSKDIVKAGAELKEKLLAEKPAAN